MSGRIHFGVIYNDGNYEYSEYYCDHIICGESSESALEIATDEPRAVTCKKCIKILNRNVKRNPNERT